MGRLGVNDVELNYPSSSGNRVPFFKIKNDRETKQIRFMYNTINDIMFDIVHEVNINGRIQTISCLNSDGQNTNACPLCAHGHKQKVLLYIPVLDLSDNTVKIWVRSRGFIAQLQGLAARNNPISGAVIEVMRNGAPGDTSTRYILQPIAPNDGVRVEQLPPIPDYSSMMRNMDYNQMNNYALALDNANFGMPANNFNSQPQYNYQPQPQIPQNNYPATNPMQGTPNWNQQQNYIPPQQNQVFGSQPVRRVPQSVPTYTQNNNQLYSEPTTNYQPQPQSPQFSPAPNQMPQIQQPNPNQVNTNQNSFQPNMPDPTVEDDDTLPF